MASASRPNGRFDGGNWKLVAAYVETESGKRADRPGLRAALSRAKAIGATSCSPSGHRGLSIQWPAIAQRRSLGSKRKRAPLPAFRARGNSLRAHPLGSQRLKISARATSVRAY